MKLIQSLLVLNLALVPAFCRDSRAAEITDLKVFSEKDYVRIAMTLDGQAGAPKVDLNAADQLVFVRFDKAGISALGKQSFLYPDNPHLESISFLPLDQASTVARVKARHPFKVQTFETANPHRFIIELDELKAPAVAAPSSGGLADSYYSQGVSRMQKGSYESALMSFRSAIRAGNHTADSYYMAGLIRARLGQDDKALTNFIRAQASVSFGDDARLYLSWLHYKQGDIAATQRSWKNFEAALPEPDKRLTIAAGHPEIDFRALEEAVKGRESRPAAAVSILDRPPLDIPAAAVGDSPALDTPLQVSGERPPADSSAQVTDSAAFFFRQAMQAKEQGRLEEAAGLLDKTLFFDKDNLQACFQLGVVYKEMGKNQLSTQFFEKSLGHKLTGGADAELIEGQAVPGEEENITPVIAKAVPEPAAIVRASTDALAGEPAVVKKDPDGKTDQAAAPAQPNTIIPDQPDIQRGGPILASLRRTAASFISLPNVELLRRRVKLLSLVLGCLFLLTLVGEKVVVRKKRKPAGPFNQIVEEYRGPVNQGNLAPQAARTPADNRNRKRQLEEVLARELESKKRARTDEEAPAVIENARSAATVAGSRSGLELRLRPVGEKGIYGADIAKRIKDELSRDDRADESQAAPGLFSRKNRDDLQTRLIRQLRNKSWTVSDIAQEMSLSREEVKWALAQSSQGRESSQGLSRENDSHLESGIGQARGLLSRRRQSSIETSGARKMDHEVDLELEINV